MTTVFFGSAGPAASPARRRAKVRTRVDTHVSAHVNAHVDTHVDTHVTVQALSSSQWRVCDTRWPEYDARSLLGFIEKRANQFDVVQINSGLKRFSFGSLAEATDHFSRGIDGRHPG